MSGATASVLAAPVVDLGAIAALGSCRAHLEASFADRLAATHADPVRAVFEPLQGGFYFGEVLHRFAFERGHDSDIAELRGLLGRVLLQRIARMFVDGGDALLQLGLGGQQSRADLFDFL